MLTDESTSVKTKRIRRIFTVFLLGIVLPAGFLSYWGFRSFQYEGLLMAKQSEERFAGTGDLIQKKVGEQVTALIVALNALSRDENVDRMYTPKLIPLTLSVSTLGGFSVDQLYIFDNKNTMLAPWAAVLDAPPGGTPLRTLDWGSLRDEENRVESLEFVDKNISKAIDGYKTLLEQTSEPPLQATLLKNLAGAYRKANEDHLAEIAYLKLLSNYDQVGDFSGYPMGVLSLELLATLYENDKSWDRKLDVQLDLFEGIIFSRWSLGAGQRRDLLRDLTVSISNALSDSSRASPGHRARWQQLQMSQRKLAAIQPKAHDFALNTWPVLLRRLHDRGWFERGGVLRLNPTEHVGTLAIVVPITSAGSVDRKGFVVATISSEPFWRSVDYSMQELAKPVNLHVTTDDSPYAGHLLRSPVVERAVDTIDPPFTFRLMGPESDNQEQFFLRRRLVYCGMIALSFVVIGVGLTAMAQAMRRETEVANLKADFVANVSHELRTPLAAISHISERLSLGRVRSEAERDEFYKLLVKETLRLRTLIEDILDFSKMLAGHKLYRRERLDLVAVMREAQDSFKGKAAAENFDVSFEVPPSAVFILGDSRAVLQAILNLLDNAIKYSGDSRRVLATLSVVGRKALVAIQDSGVGIAEAEKSRIFEKFYRVEQTTVTGSERGVGLGLSMVKHIMDGHDGRIRLVSELGKGSIFTLEFPLDGGG